MTSQTYLKSLFWIAVAAWAAALFINGQPLTVALFKPASLVQSLLILVITVFDKWAWRWPLLNLFVKRPNLIGFYKGQLRSQWINPETKQGIAPITSFLVIRQTFSDIHIRLYTAQSQSGSLQACITRDPAEHQELIFNYRNEPKIEHRSHSPIHYGGAKVQISQDTSSLDGSYWTDRATIGGMSFTRLSRETPMSFEEAGELAARASP